MDFSDMTEEESLAHFGKLGMKWGQRNRGRFARGATKARVALNAGGQVINEGHSKLVFLPQKHRDAVAHNTQNRVLGVARQVNKDPKFHGKDLKRNPALRAEYHRQVTQHAKNIYAEELAKARGDAVFETINAIMSPRGDQMHFVAPHQARHAAGEDILLTLNLTRDSLDHIVDMKPANSSALAQSNTVDNILMHLGNVPLK